MSKRSRARNKQLRNIRQKQKATAKAGAAATRTASSVRIVKLNRRSQSRIAEAAYLIEDGDFVEAEEILTSENRRHPDHPDILNALLYLYQTRQDHRLAAITAERLVQLRPTNPEFWLSMAQGYLFCGRAPMALNAYRHFLDVWPDHEYASKAEAAIHTIEPHVAEMLNTFELSEDELELMVLHDEILFGLYASRFEDSAAKARELLAVKPRMVSARNNLTIALFQLGHMTEAVAASRETLAEFPGNEFAEASLGRYLMLSGHIDEANAIADRIAATPSNQQDAIANQVEFLSMLGRDDDVLKLVACGEQIPHRDSKCSALLLHHKAVALARKGDESAAKKCWQQSVQLFPDYDPASENLRDFANPRSNRHAPWGDSVTSWIPSRVMEHFGVFATKRVSQGDEYPVSTALKRFPHIATLVPALLDRGDAAGREFAFNMATAVASPEFLDALQDFAAGTRGPDALRSEALSVLKEKGRLSIGPHRIFLNGEWQDIEIFSPVITDEPKALKTPELEQLHNEGCHALSGGDYVNAEQIFRRCVELDPDDVSAIHNRAAALLRFPGDATEAEARTLLEDLHERFPDYPFARTSLAQLAIQDGDLDTARDLIAPLRLCEQMHRSEFMALLGVQANLALAQDNLKSAEVVVSTMEKMDPSHPSSTNLRRRLDFANSILGRLSGPKGMEVQRNLTGRLTHRS